MVLVTSTAGPRLPTADVRQTSMICSERSWMAHAGRGRGLAGDRIGERRVRGPLELPVRPST